MFSEEELDAAWGMVQAPKQQTQTRPVQNKKKKSFLVDNISTVGGIVGGIGGGIAGGLAGGFGAIPGAAAGGAGGSALGEAIENLIMGEKVTKNVGKEAALGGVFGAGPVRGAKFAAGAGKELLKGGGKAGVRAASDEASKFTIRGAVGSKLSNKATDLATRQFGLTDSFIAKYTKKHGEDAGKTITRYSIQTADDAEKAIRSQQDLFNSLIDTAGNIPRSSVEKQLRTASQSLLKQGPTDLQQMGRKLQAETDQLLSQFGDEIPATALNGVRQQYDTLVNYSLKMSDPRTYEVNKRVADSLRKTIQTASGNNQLKETGRELSKLRTLADEMEARAPKVASRGASPLGFRNLMGAGIGGGIGLGAGGPLGAVAGAALVAGANSPTGRKMATNAALRGGAKLLESGSKAAPAQMSAKGTALRLGATGVLTNQGTQPENQNLEDVLMGLQSSQSGSALDAQMPSNDPANMSSNDMAGLYQNEGDLSSGAEQSPYSRNNLLADMQRDPANADKYFEYYQMLQEVFAPVDGADKPLSAEAAKVVSNANIGLEAINDFETAITNDPSVLQKRLVPGRGALGGAIGGILGTRGADAASQQIIDVIARLRTGAAITNDEAKRFEQFIPQAGDNEAVRRQKLGYLRNQFNAVANRTGGGSATLEDALMQQQTGGY